MGTKVGVAVVCLACVVGALACSGEQGKTGAQGEPGAVGMNGTDGQDGAEGPAGDPGTMGAQGPAGEQGEPGVAGPAGPQGLPGDKGDQGDKGDKGDKGDAAGGAGAGGADSGPDAALHAPGLVLLDKNDEPAHAWILEAWPPYGESFNKSCVRLSWIEQRAAYELQLDLATGTFEPCYTAYASWTEAAKSLDAASFVRFHSTDCTGPAYSPFVISTRLKVAGVLHDAHGAALAPIGLGTGEPASRYDGDTCKNVSNEGPFTDLRAFAPIDPEFRAAFDAPPYSVKVVY